MTTRTRKKPVPKTEETLPEVVGTTVITTNNGVTYDTKYVTQDDYTRSMAQLGVDAVRTKADILQIRDELKAQKENWSELCAINIRLEQQKNAIAKLRKDLLTARVTTGIVAGLALVALFI